jgi:PTH1 family peptidyl-tRNA hydrolase
MKLFVGLGNPGAKYAGNRHNIGFMALDRIAADHGFGPWKRAFQGLACEGRLGEEKVILLKPETFMNLSGQSVAEAMRFYKLTPADITVLHDELDLAPGKARVKQGGGHAGHNGLRSIHGHIGEAYGRVRLGIGHPGHKDAVAAYVLHDFAKADQDWLDDLLRGISDGAAALAAGDGAKFMNAVALRTAPPRSSTSDKPAPKTAKLPPEPATKPAAQPEEDTRNPMQKLLDRFR